MVKLEIRYSYVYAECAYPNELRLLHSCFVTAQCISEKSPLFAQVKPEAVNFKYVQVPLALQLNLPFNIAFCIEKRVYKASNLTAKNSWELETLRILIAKF